MTDTTADRGAIGTVADAVSRAKQGFAASISNHDGWAIRLVFLAGILTILHKAGVQNVGFGIPPYAVVFAVCLGVAALLYEMNATTYALRAFWNGRFVGTLGWSLIWLVAFGYSMNQWIGAASESEGVKSNMHKAAYVSFADTRDELTSAKAEVNRLEQRLTLKPIRNAEQAQAAIDNAKAHKFWKATSECKETKGPQTRQFCSEYASAVADKAGSTEMLTVAEEMKQAKARLTKAQNAAGNTKAEVSEGRNDLMLLTKYAGMNETDARALNALGSIIAISIFLSLATALRELEHLRATRKRVPMFPIRAWYAALYRFLTGKDIAPAAVYNVSVDEQHFLNVRKALGGAMRTA